MDLNHGPLPYQGSALTELSYSPEAIALTCAAIDLSYPSASAGVVALRCLTAYSPVWAPSAGINVADFPIVEV